VSAEDPAAAVTPRDPLALAIEARNMAMCVTEGDLDHAPHERQMLYDLSFATQKLIEEHASVETAARVWAENPHHSLRLRWEHGEWRALTIDESYFWRLMVADRRRRNHGCVFSSGRVVLREFGFSS